VHRRRAAPAIDDPGGVAHQVLEGDRARGRHGVIARAAVIGAQYRDLHLRELRQIGRDRVVDLHEAVLVQLQRADRDHGLGHRGDAEDGVGSHLGAGVLVEVAEGLEVDELAAARDGDHGAGQAALVDVGAQHLTDARQALRGHADRLRLGCRQGIRGECGSEAEKCGQCSEEAGESCAHGSSQNDGGAQVLHADRPPRLAWPRSRREGSRRAGKFYSLRQICYREIAP
jgi:hypothetical protein